MIKVLLVDDDYAQCAYLRKILDWKSLNCNIVGEFSNGLEALDGIVLHKPDVIFLDVDMPTMDGLTFLEHLHNQKSSIKTVIVSGHRKFDYACKAMSNGAHFYLLKPINKEELLDILKKIIAIIEEERAEELELNVLHEKLDETMPLLKNQLLRKMVINCINEPWSDIDVESALFNVDITSSHLLTAVIEKDDDFNSNTSNNHDILQHTLEDACLTYLKNYIYDSFIDELHNLTLVVDILPENRSFILEDLGKLVEYIHINTNQTITIGCSRLYPMNLISKAYEESYHILQSKTYLSSNTVLDYNSNQPVNKPYVALTPQYKEQISLCIKYNNPEKLISIIHEIYENHSRGQVTMTNLRIISSELVTIGITYLSSLGYSISQVFGNNYNPLHLLLDYNSLYGIKQYIIHFFETICKYTKNIAPPKLNNVIIKAQNYIQQHYDESGLSLENIATSLYIHPVYLSSLFKKSIHKTITQYIINIRMEEAMKLIKMERGISIREIASLTGYENPYYFSKVFKKYYGVSPTDLLKKV